MEKFTKIKAISAPLPLINIDTDMIIPKQFLKTIKRTGLGKHLFDEMRYNKDGSEVENFILNDKHYRNSKIIVAGDNFGCGSSREHAPWALLDFGIRVIISTSFADIFYNNCFKNGILPIILPKKQRDFLIDDCNEINTSIIEVDLRDEKIIRSDNSHIYFEIESYRKDYLIQGLDDIAITLNKIDKIIAYENSKKNSFPWL